MIELNKKRRKVFYGFAAVYVVMLLALGWLFFLSPGIELTEEINSGGKTVYAVNQSGRIQNNVEVYYFINEEKIIVKKIDSMKPEQIIEIDLSEFQEMDSIQLFAEAPFHNAFSKIIPLQSSSFELNYRIKAPTLNFTGTPVEVNLVIENKGKAIEGIKLSETHDNEALRGENGVKTISVSKNESKEIAFLFTALKPGKTEIIFNVQTPNNTEELKHEIFISEG
ncbi:MAG: hypothetical protein ABIA76_01135 [Candidatus Diapherotrites archaeon]